MQEVCDLSEPAMDLGLVLAVISSYRDVPIPDKTLVFGEVGLSGEVRAVSMAQQRVQEAKTLRLRPDYPSEELPWTR